MLETGSKKTLNFPILLLISAIGPNIGLGFRLEHLIIYVSLIVIILDCIVSPGNVKFNFKILKLSIPLFIAFLAVLISDYVNNPKFRDGSLISGIDNLSQPILVLITMSYFINRSSFDYLKILRSLIFFGVFIGIINILSIFIDLSLLFQYFIADIDDDNGLWNQVLSLGRYIGLFSQPFEAGIFFAICLFSFVFINTNKEKITFWQYSTFLILLTGGLITLSKNFYLLGLCLSFFLFARLSSWSLKKSILIFTIIIICIIILLVLFYNLLGNYLQSLVEIYSSDGLFSALTAGRFGGGESTNVEILFSEVVNEKFYGFGIGTKLPLDNGFLEYFYQGGFFALLGYLFFILYILYFFILHNDKKESFLLFTLVMFIFLASFGGPVLTANRSNIFLLVLLSATIYKLNNYKYDA